MLAKNRAHRTKKKAGLAAIGVRLVESAGFRDVAGRRTDVPARQSEATVPDFLRDVYARPGWGWRRDG